MAKYRKPVIQIEVTDPIQDRRTAHGMFRPLLNAAEKDELRTKMKVDEALLMFVESSMAIPDIAKALELNSNELTAMALSPHFPEFKFAMAQRAGEMFLSLEENHTRADICRMLGMSPMQLRHFTKSDIFKERYRELWGEMTSDPIIKAVEVKMTEDLLPLAFRALREELTNGSGTTRLKAALEVLKYSGVEAQAPQRSDRAELATFLAQPKNVVNIENMNVNIPQEFKDAVDANLPPVDVIEGNVEEVD